MGKGIRLSKEHGVNPTKTVCFFCDNVKGIAFLGKLKGDAKAPAKMLIDYEPCDECAEKFKGNILWIEVSDIPITDNQAPIAKDAYPTGRWAVTKPDVLDTMYSRVSINGRAKLDDIRSKGNALVDSKMFEAITGGKK